MLCVCTYILYLSWYSSGDCTHHSPLTAHHIAWFGITVASKANNYKGGSILSRMEKGMIFTIEPAVNEGARTMHILEDGWTAITNDDGRSAQFEHTIIITDTGAERLTA